VVSARRLRSFRRLETDDEFRARLRGMKRVVWTMRIAEHCCGEALDDFAEEHYRAQRRLLWVEE